MNSSQKDQVKHLSIFKESLHIEGVMDTGEHVTFDVPTPAVCTKIRQALGFFDILPTRSSCTDGCDGCGPSIDANALVCF
ncbi:hypothetical protein KKF61_07860 [Patescibacteria group bacterium]|nr:hypothetical protein [Patescibacteria group bacterium]